MKDNFQCLGIFVVLWMIIISMFFATTTRAQEPNYITSPPSFQLAEPMALNASTIPSGASITPVHVGDRARANGVLYNLEANAWLISELERIQLYWIMEMNTRVNLTMTWARHEILSQENRNNAALEIFQVRLDERERTAQNLNDINRRLMTQVGWTRREKFRFFVSVVGVGALAGVGGYFIGRVSR